MSTIAAYVSTLAAPATTDLEGPGASGIREPDAIATTARDTFELSAQGADTTTIEVLPAHDPGDLTEVVSGAGSASLETLQEAAAAILKHIVPSLLGDREAAARSMLDALATVLTTSRDVPSSQQLRDALADWIQRVTDYVGQPVRDALRAESGTATTATSGTAGTTVAPSATNLTPAQVAASFLTTPLAGNGGDNWTARVPAGIQAQIAANGGVFTGYATLLTQVPVDLDATETSGQVVWWTGAFVAARSAGMLGYRDENNELVYTDPTRDPMTGLPVGILGQPNVFFQPCVGYAQDSGFSLGGLATVGIHDPSLAGWAQAPTLCLDEVTEILTQGLRSMGVPDDLIPQALESCYKYDPAFGVLIPEGVGEAAMQLYQSRHGDWYDAVFEAIPALIVAVVAPELVGLVAPGLVGAAAGVLGVSQTVAQGIIAAGVTGGTQAAMNGGNFFQGFLTGLAASYGGALAGNWASMFGAAGSQAVTAMASSAIRQLFSSGQIDLRQVVAAGVGAGLTVQLDATTGLPRWATGAIGQGTATYIITGNAGAAAAAAVNGAVQSAFTSGTTSPAPGTGPRDGVLELVVTVNGEYYSQGSGTLTQLPDGTYAITTANHLFTDASGRFMLVDPVTHEASYIGEGGFGLRVMYQGRPIDLPMSSLITDAVIDQNGHYTFQTNPNYAMNDAMAIMLPPGWVAQNIPELGAQVPVVAKDPPVVGQHVRFSGFPGGPGENGDRNFVSSGGTIVSVNDVSGFTVQWEMDADHPNLFAGVSGGKVYNDQGELIGIVRSVSTSGNTVTARFTPVRLDANGNLLIGNQFGIPGYSNGDQGA